MGRSTVRSVVSNGGGTVGFDLDMTLIDSRPGILDTLAVLAGECDAAGHEGDGEALRDPGLLDALLRRNLDLVLADRLPADRAGPLADRFRELYVEHGVPGSFLLPGALDAIGTVRAAGARAIVVTAKFEPNAWRCLHQVGIEVDAVYGWRLGAAKAGPLVEEAAEVYVGDTPRDVEAARVAGAAAVGVSTGPHPAEELRDAGADVVLSSLVDFPAWWAAHRGRC